MTRQWTRHFLLRRRFVPLDISKTIYCHEGWCQTLSCKFCGRNKFDYRIQAAMLYITLSIATLIVSIDKNLNRT